MSAVAIELALIKMRCGVWFCLCYAMLCCAVLCCAEFQVSEAARKHLREYRLTHQITAQTHVALLQDFGWTLDEYEVRHPQPKSTQRESGR